MKILGQTQIILGNSSGTPQNGELRWDGTNFQIYDGTNWQSLLFPADRDNLNMQDLMLMGA